MLILNTLESITEKVNAGNDFINNIVWGIPMIVLILAVGIYYTVRLGFPQITKIKQIYKGTVGKKEEITDGKGVISSSQAALISMGEIVGSGNIAGVATAVASGGPGAIFWMWIAAIFGMATKYVEIGLGILYRKVNKDNVKGGPMYYLRDGLHSKFLAAFYAIMAVLSYIVIVAMVDTNTIVNAIQARWTGVHNYTIGLVLIVIVGIVIFGGIKRLGKFSNFVVPVMAFLYIISGIVVLVVNAELIGPAFLTIIKAAFTPQAAVGGFAGASVMQAMRYGFARGIYSNEAGLGTAAISHSAAQVKNPIEQSLWAPVEIFIDTIIVNTITGLVVVIAGLWNNGTDGAELVMNSFDKVLPNGPGSIIILIASILFSFTCLTSASYVCEECAEYLFGTKSKTVVRILWLLFILIGSVLELELVWNLADTVNGLMLIPNLIGVIFLGSAVVRASKEYFKKA